MKTLFAILVAASFCLTTGQVVAEELTYTNQPQFGVGYKIVGVNDRGVEITQEIVKEDDLTWTWKEEGSCFWTSPKDELAPPLKWWGCRGPDGGYISKLVSGNPYPLKVGNSWKYSMDGWEAGSNNWQDTRACEVTGTQQITVKIGTFNTFVVVCNQKKSTRTFYMEPSLGVIKRIKDHKRRGKKSWELKEVLNKKN